METESKWLLQLFLGRWHLGVGWYQSRCRWNGTDVVTYEEPNATLIHWSVDCPHDYIYSLRFDALTCPAPDALGLFGTSRRAATSLTWLLGRGMWMVVCWIAVAATTLMSECGWVLFDLPPWAKDYWQDARVEFFVLGWAFKIVFEVLQGAAKDSGVLERCRVSASYRLVIPAASLL